LAGFGCAAHAVLKMSSRSQPLRRTFAALQNWSLDRHHKPLNVLRSRISALGRSISLPKEGMSGAAAETRAASLTAEIDDFRNKIGT
jgi:hypothetical protein